MPKQAVFTREKITEKAFEIFEKYGLEYVTARNVGTALKSSPIPIYSSFNSMQDLKEELINKAKDLFIDYVKREKKKSPFLGTWTGIILFSKNEKQLFRSIFLRKNSYGGLIEEFKGLFQEEVILPKQILDLSSQAQEALFLDCWIYTHGLAILICTGHFEEEDILIKKRLKSALVNIIKKKKITSKDYI